LSQSRDVITDKRGRGIQEAGDYRFADDVQGIGLQMNGQGITDSLTQCKGCDYRWWAGDYRFVVTAQGFD